MKTKRIHADIISNTEGMDIYSISYRVSEKLKERINIAARILRVNPVLISVTIDGDELNSSVRQYDSSIDDIERKEISKGSFDYFKTDVHNIIVYRHAGIWFRAYSKWDGSQFYEVELEVE